MRPSILEHDVEAAALVLNIEICVGGFMVLQPVVDDDSVVSITHQLLSQKIRTVIYNTTIRLIQRFLRRQSYPNGHAIPQGR